MPGCWTCRARKKKCGQQEPFCDECERLGLKCDGYGQRPDWADGGEKENDHKARLKTVVKHRIRYKRTRGLSDVLFTPPQTFDLLFDTTDVLDDFEDYQIAQISSPPKTPSLAAQAAISFPHLEKTIDRSHGQSLDNLTFSIMQDNKLYDGDELGCLPYVTNPWSDSSQCYLPFASEDCQLLLHYLDSVFWMQYHHLDKNTTIDRAWILVFFQSSEVFRRALRQLSRYSYTLKDCTAVQNDVLHQEGSLSSIHDMVCVQAKDLMNQDSTSCKENAIILLSATALSAFHGMMAGNREHVRSSLMLASGLLKQIKKITGEPWTYLNTDYDISDTSSAFSAALKLSSIQLLWIDTFEAIMTEATCILHPHLISEEPCLNTDIEVFVGCRSWILHTIYGVAELRAWKKACLVSGRLSMSEMTRRSRDLLDRVEQRGVDCATEPNSFASITGTNYAEHMHRLSNASDVSDVASLQSETTVDIITRFYAQAIAVYVHVIISGANPGFMEIQSSISTALNLFEQLQSIDVLASVSWPFLVFACFSTDLQRERCQHILNRAKYQQKLQRACLTILGIAQECWTLANETPSMMLDWQVVINDAYRHISRRLTSIY